MNDVSQAVCAASGLDLIEGKEADPKLALLLNQKSTLKLLRSATKGGRKDSPMFSILISKSNARCTLVSAARNRFFDFHDFSTLLN